METENKMLVNEEGNELKTAEAKEEKAEKEIVEKAVEEVERGEESVVEAEKEIAENIAEEEEKVEEVKDKIEKGESKSSMREIEIEKMVLNCGGIDDKLERSVKLLKMITGKKVYIVKATKRIPAFGISPKKQSGCKVTLRDKEQISKLLREFFAALDNTLAMKQITKNQVSFGIHEYIEVPGLEYDRDIGISGFEASVVFKRKGKRVKMRKVKKGRFPGKQDVTREEVRDFLIKNFEVEVEEK